MDANELIYESILVRYVRMAWNHKIQEQQADLYCKRKVSLQRWLIGLSAVSTCGILTIITELSSFCTGFDIAVKILTALLAATTTYITCVIKEADLDENINACKQFAAVMHDMRNRYESLLYDFKSGAISSEGAIRQRTILENEENNRFMTIAPHTTSKAVEKAREALIKSGDNAVSDEERKNIVPKELQYYRDNQ